MVDASTVQKCTDYFRTMARWNSGNSNAAASRMITSTVGAFVGVKELGASVGPTVGADVGLEVGEVVGEVGVYVGLQTIKH